MTNLNPDLQEVREYLDGLYDSSKNLDDFLNKLAIAHKQVLDRRDELQAHNYQLLSQIRRLITREYHVANNSR